MKYTIHGFQQNKLIELGLDNNDALILSVIRDMYASQSIEFQIIDGERYIWVNQSNLILDQIPIIGHRTSLLRRLSNLEEKGIIIRKLSHEKLNKKDKQFKKGNFCFIKLTSKLDYLMEYDLVAKCNNPCSEIQQPLVAKCDNKDSPIKDSDNIYSQVIDYLNSKAGKSFKCTTKKTQDLIKARLADGFKKEEFFMVIDNKVKEWQGTEYEKYLRPETLFGNKFEGYLNQGVNKKNYEERKENSSKDSFDY
ncbi:conserved phage C-terminal domain-containing protein [Clostridium perfringens]|uniref:conserved phage C-terminal domain-containing protein n=1 Tax=Clostridium perfringens TaxID=1502 RepID=UPI003B02A506